MCVCVWSYICICEIYIYIYIYIHTYVSENVQDEWNNLPCVSSAAHRMRHQTPCTARSKSCRRVGRHIRFAFIEVFWGLWLAQYRWKKWRGFLLDHKGSFALNSNDQNTKTTNNSCRLFHILTRKARTARQLLQSRTSEPQTTDPKTTNSGQPAEAAWHLRHRRLPKVCEGAARPLDPSIPFEDAGSSASFFFGNWGNPKHPQNRTAT